MIQSVQPSTTDFRPAYRRIADCIAAQRRQPSDPLTELLADVFQEPERREADLEMLHAIYADRIGREPPTIDVFARRIVNLGYGLTERGGYVLATARPS